jgi:hypothetical protein
VVYLIGQNISKYVYFMISTFVIILGKLELNEGHFNIIRYVIIAFK